MKKHIETFKLNWELHRGESFRWFLAVLVGICLFGATLTFALKEEYEAFYSSGTPHEESVGFPFAGVANMPKPKDFKVLTSTAMENVEKNAVIHLTYVSDDELSLFALKADSVDVYVKVPNTGSSTVTIDGLAIFGIGDKKVSAPLKEFRTTTGKHLVAGNAWFDDGVLKIRWVLEPKQQMAKLHILGTMFMLGTIGILSGLGMIMYSNFALGLTNPFIRNPYVPSNSLRRRNHRVKAEAV